MKEKTGLFLLFASCVLLAGTSCGFKSDLYLPGQPQKVEQYDSKSLKDLGDQKLRQLQKQGEVSPSATTEVSVGEQENAEGTGDEIPHSGIVVELPSTEEIAQEKADTRKKSVKEN